MVPEKLLVETQQGTRNLEELGEELETLHSSSSGAHLYISFTHGNL